MIGEALAARDVATWLVLGGEEKNAARRAFSGLGVGAVSGEPPE